MEGGGVLKCFASGRHGGHRKFYASGSWAGGRQNVCLRERRYPQPGRRFCHFPYVVFFSFFSERRNVPLESATGGGFVSTREQMLHRAKIRSLKIATVIVVAFIMCWTPYYVTFIISTFSRQNEVVEKSSKWVFAFGMANSLVNPLIYGAFHIFGKKR